MNKFELAVEARKERERGYFKRLAALVARQECWQDSIALAWARDELIKSHEYLKEDSDGED